MAFREWNPNPAGRRVGDCAVRAVARALGTDWDQAFLLTAISGLSLKNIQNGDEVWGNVLRQNGFRREAIPNTCPACYTVADFARDHPKGTYVLALGGHVVTLENGDWFDTWDSGTESPSFYFYREEEQ